ncbi:MAG: ribosome recycling factor [Thermaceae bacterium]
MLKALYQEIRTQMQKSLEVFEHNLAGIRSGRANPALLLHLKVEYYGTQVPLNQIATVTAPDARTLVVQSWDQNALKAIEKAIRDSDLGLNPSNRGDALYIPIPPLTEERRKELVRTVRQMAEEARVAIRNIRREGLERLKKVEKELHLSEDEAKRAEGEVQKITDEFIAKVDQALEKKEAEILG